MLVCGNITVLIKILSSAAEYLTITEVEIPVPPEYGLLRDENQNIIKPLSLIEVESDNRNSIIPSIGFVLYF